MDVSKSSPCFGIIDLGLNRQTMCFLKENPFAALHWILLLCTFSLGFFPCCCGEVVIDLSPNERGGHGSNAGLQATNSDQDDWHCSPLAIGPFTFASSVCGAHVRQISRFTALASCFRELGKELHEKSWNMVLWKCHGRVEQECW